MTLEQQLGIYCLINKTTNERFINSTKNINTYKNSLVKKLNKNEHRNKRLQNAWNTYKEEVFEFQILEIVTYPELLGSRKLHWINTYISNVVGNGYNLELTKRPWQLKREEWLKEKSWNVEGTIRDILGDIISKLDYEIEFAEDRNRHLRKMLDENKLNWFIDYISSPLFCDKQIKIKSDFLTEDDISLIGFSILVDYLTFPKFKNKKQQQKHEIRLKKSEVKMDHTRGNEVLFGDKTEIENRINKSESSNPNVKESSKQKIHKVETKYKIKDEDLEMHPEIKEIQNVLTYLKSTLGYGKSEDERNRLQLEIEEKYNANQLKKMKSLYNDLSSEVLIMKEKLIRTFQFKRLLGDTTVFDYGNDTGYFSGDNNSGDYVLVSENKIDFSKEKHIFELINFYSQLKQRVHDEPDSDMWAILFDLDELIDKTKFDDYIKDILIMKIDGYEVNEIIEDIEKIHGIKLTDDRLSRIYNEVIPKMIVDTYLQDREEWIYTYKARGKYKTCRMCDETTLLNEKYYRKRVDSKDGFRNECRKCEVTAKIKQ